MMRGARILVLAGIWMALWSDLSIANALSGLAIALGITVIFAPHPPGQLIIRPIHQLRFALYFAWMMAQSTVVVARAVVSPHEAVHTGIVAVPLHGCSDAVVTLIADAITLTPGSLTVEVRREPPVLFVHALDLRDVEGVQATIRTLEVLAIRAFGSDEALAGLTVDDSFSWRGR